MEPNNNNMQNNPIPTSITTPNPTPAPIPMASSAAMPPKPGSSAGTIVGVVVLLAVLVIGGFYFWGQSADDMSTGEPDAMMQESDTAADLEADLNASDIDNVDYDLNPDNFNAS